AFLRDEDDERQSRPLRAQIRHLVRGLRLRFAFCDHRLLFCGNVRLRISQRLLSCNAVCRDQAGAGSSAISRPRAASAVATIWRGLSPAVSYCPFGESCSRNRSGSTIGRILRPLSSCPVIARCCSTWLPTPPIEPSSIVITTSCARTSRLIRSVSSGLAKRASATVVDSP